MKNDKDADISADSKIVESELGSDVKVYSLAEIVGSTINDLSIVGDQAIIIDSQLGKYVSINRRNYILRSRIGRSSYTGIGTSIRSSTVGNFCSISWNVSIGGGNHEFDRVTSSPLWRLNMMEYGNTGHKSNTELQRRFEELPDCIIGNDVWIATNAVILRNVKIGNGAIIGASAVVTRDVAPYSIVTGVPAKTIRRRFNDIVINELEEIRWWDWPADIIRKNADLIYRKKVSMDVIERLRQIKSGLG